MAAGLAAPWWATVRVPRSAVRSEDLLGTGSAVPVRGPGARDTDGDGRADVLLVDGPYATTRWTDTDGDGLADQVLTLDLPDPP
ncbi:DUF6802 family protein [Pseudonocardia sp. HH130630-07]|uniref:DUF6802 family protein n=1 Tax=Pseudonocardia sp. HH130630-07 TaxID=1690815 RepID=UPI0008151BA1|nr:DUF6802 family protein [Pseudonocardia sp. HH130630-07]ANY06803.1 hypothetical protein AFB00_11460 [Pseudonocardia sp. HH130630-07]